MATAEATVTYREIPGHPGYRVGDDGSVWSCWQRTRPSQPWATGETWRLLAAEKTRRGYLRVALYRQGAGQKRYAVHRLVLEAFVGPCPDGMEGCHRDGNRSNNAFTNLRWDTPQANWEDRKRHGRGQSHSKLSAEQVSAIRRLVSAGGSKRSIAKKFGVARSTVLSIVDRTTWADVE